MPEPKPELPKTGINLERDDGGWINVAVDNNRFVVTFFDGEKAPIKVDLHHGLVRYSYVAKGKARVVLARSARRVNRE